MSLQRQMFNPDKRVRLKAIRWTLERGPVPPPKVVSDMFERYPLRELVVSELDGVYNQIPKENEYWTKDDQQRLDNNLNSLKALLASQGGK